MTQLRRLRAGFQLSLVSGGLWAVAGGIVGAALVLQGGASSRGTVLSTLLLIAACAAVPGLVGMVGGSFFASFLAARGASGGVSQLSRGHVLLAGAAGGIAVKLLIQYVVLRPFLTTIPESTLIGTLISFGFFGGLGALTGAAILGTARRAQLAPGEEDLDMPEQPTQSLTP